MLVLLLAANLFVLQRHVLSEKDSPQDKDQTFEKVVQPFFANHCFACHNDDRHTAGLNLEALDNAEALTKDRAKLNLLFTKLKSGQMPPPDQPRPNADTMAAVVD